MPPATRPRAPRSWGLKGDNGRPLGLMPDLLVVPGSLEGAARRVVKVSTLTGGGDNTWYNTADLLVSPLL